MLRSQFDSHRHVKVLFFSIGVTYRETLGMLKPVTAPFPLLLPSGHSLMALLGGLWSRDPQCWGRAGDRGTSSAARDRDSRSKHSCISFGWCLYVGNQSSKPVFVCFRKLQCQKMVGCLVSVMYFPALSCAGVWRWEPLLKVGTAEVTTRTHRAQARPLASSRRVSVPPRQRFSAVSERPRRGGGAPGAHRGLAPGTQPSSIPCPTKRVQRQGSVCDGGVEGKAHTCARTRGTHTARLLRSGPAGFLSVKSRTASEGGHQKHRRQLTVRLKGTEFLKTKNSQDL